MRLPFPRCSLAVAFGSWDDWNWLGSWKLVLSSSTEASWLELEPPAPEKKGKRHTNLKKRQRQKDNSAILVRQFQHSSAFSIQLRLWNKQKSVAKKIRSFELSGFAAIRFESDGPRLHQRLRQNLQTKWKFPAFVLGEVNWWMTFFWMFPKTFWTSKRKKQNNETFCWWWLFSLDVLMMLMMLMMLMRRFGATGELSLPFRREMPSQMAPWKSGGNWHVRTASVQCEIALYFTGAADGLKVDLGKDLERFDLYYGFAQDLYTSTPQWIHGETGQDLLIPSVLLAEAGHVLYRWKDDDWSCWITSNHVCLWYLWYVYGIVYGMLIVELMYALCSCWQTRTWPNNRGIMLPVTRLPFSSCGCYLPAKKLGIWVPRNRGIPFLPRLFSATTLDDARLQGLLFPVRGLRSLHFLTFFVRFLLWDSQELTGADASTPCVLPDLDAALWFGADRLARVCITHFLADHRYLDFEMTYRRFWVLLL